MQGKSYLSKVVLMENLLDEDYALEGLRADRYSTRAITNLRRSVLYTFESKVTVRNETDLFWFNRKVDDWFHRPTFLTVAQYSVIDGNRLAYRHGSTTERGQKGFMWQTAFAEMPDDARVYDAVIALAEKAGLPPFPYSYRSVCWLESSNPKSARRLEWLWYAYPLLRELRPQDWYHLGEQMQFDSIFLRRLLESKNLRQGATKIYGRGATRAHMKQLAQHLQVGFNPTLANNMVLADMLKGLVPVDYLLKAYTDVDVHMFAPFERRLFRDILREIPNPRRRFNIVCDGHRWIRDIVRMRLTLNGIAAQGVEIVIDISDARSAEEIHNRYVRELNRFHSAGQLEQENRVIDSKRYAEWDGKVVGDMVIYAPEQASDLIHWGIEMNHCIGAYTDDAVNPDGMLYFAIRKNGKLYANAQVRPHGRQSGSLVQLFGADNKSLPADEAVVLSNAFGVPLSSFMRYFYPDLLAVMFDDDQGDGNDPF